MSPNVEAHVKRIKQLRAQAGVRLNKTADAIRGERFEHAEKFIEQNRRLNEKLGREITLLTRLLQ